MLRPASGCVASRTAVALTHRGRAALDTYAEALRGLLDGL
jgi:hypothetical protein